MFIKILNCLLFSGFLFLAGCQEDLVTESPEAKSLSGQQGEMVSDFSATLNTGNTLNLSQRLNDHDAVVLYFTMWCVVCDSHTSQLKNAIEPAHGNVDIILVDYISASLSYSRESQQNQGFMSFDVITDLDGNLEQSFSATMGTIVVIDKNFVVRMNQYFSDNQSVFTALDQL